eukprot:2414082-Lingulodinium_polyedra.AAC.1
MASGPMPLLSTARRSPAAVRRGAAQHFDTREAPPVVGARWHQEATGASAPETNPCRELDDPVRGVPEHLVVHVLHEPSRVAGLAE